MTGAGLRRTRPRLDGIGRSKHDRDFVAIPATPWPYRHSGFEISRLHRRHIWQPVGPVYPAPDTVNHQPETRVHVAVPGHQRLHSPRLCAGQAVRESVVARHRLAFVDVPDPRPDRVLRAQFRLRGHRDGRRTLAGLQETIFLSEGDIAFKTIVYFCTIFVVIFFFFFFSFLIF